MNPFVKGVLSYSVQVTAALLVGTVIGSLSGVGLRMLFGDSAVDREDVVGIINTAIFATMGTLALLSGIGAFPVKSK